MTSSKPYLVRALYDWILDNDLTPYLMVNAEADEVIVPVEYVEEGRIILNINPGATHDLMLGNSEITFNARFAGTPMNIYIPIDAVMAIYARENGQGMMFTEEHDGDEPPPTTEPDNGGDGPKLKLVK
jgi:stringent starvation protein B